MTRRTVDGIVLWAVSLACLLPLLWLVWRGYQGELGANPIETVIRNLGVWGLRLLIVGLTITPLARILKRPRLIRVRRPIGLIAFSYIVLHLSTYIGVDQYFDWASIWKDILKRPFITIGVAAFLLLIPMAATSFNAAIRWLGSQRWRGLHRLIYLIVPMGVVHYYLLVKADHRPPLIYGGIVAVLLGWRAVAALKRR
ncbi:MAG: protein-methionine-sulfoxide reductase heme-binding subunit MsrQ [Caulobacter sp.]|nr:protein-methionine-sulfoxide reductase heme-binding subunit MsrQ [Caulobacter sp.]